MLVLVKNNLGKLLIFVYLQIVDSKFSARILLFWGIFEIQGGKGHDWTWGSPSPITSEPCHLGLGNI